MHVIPLRYEGQVQTRGNLFNGFRIFISIGSQFVIEVRHDHTIPGFVKYTHQTQTIRSAGNPHDDGFVFHESTLIVKNGFDVFKHDDRYNPLNAKSSLLYQIERLHDLIQLNQHARCAFRVNEGIFLAIGAVARLFIDQADIL